MMLRALIFSMVYWLFFSHVNLRAQQYNFRNYSVAEGLPQSQVYAMCQDKRGFLWFGTRGGGLAQFNGLTFTTFTENDGLSSNFINTIIEDKSGNIWIGTDAGLHIYNGQKMLQVKLEKDTQAFSVNNLYEDKNGNIWIGANNGILYQYQGKKLTKHQQQNGKPYPRISSIIELRDTLYIGTQNGLFRKTDNWQDQLTTKNGLSSNVISAMAVDKTGKLWLATYTGGACVYNGNSFKAYKMKNGLAGNTLMTVLADKQGRIWFGSGGNGLSRFDGDTFRTFTEREGLCGNVVMSLLQDAQGNMWIGSSGGGVSRLDNERFIRFTEESSQMGDQVYAIHQDKNGLYWFASSFGGVTTYDGRIYRTYRKKSGFTNSKVRSIYEDKDGNLWFGTLGDWAYKYDGKNFTHLIRKDGVCGNFVNSITGDKDGNIWLATAGGGACVIPYNRDPKNALKRITFRTKQLGTDRIFSVLADSAGSIWLGTSGAGIIRIRNWADSNISIQKYTQANGFPAKTVRCLAMAENGFLYAGTAGSGVVKIAPMKEPVFLQYGRKNGLSSDNIYSLVFDNACNLWVGSEKGLDKLSFGKNNGANRIKHYGKAEGFTGIETIQGAAARDKNGRLWFGTINGTTSFDPALDEANLVPPQVHLTGIKLFFKRIEETGFGKSLRGWFSLPETLELPHTQNHLSFDFIGINLRNPEGVTYKWKLDGFDEDWSPVNSLTNATYSNLSPGKYTFRVLAANEDGIWSPQPAAFAFSITPPFWQKWWFRVLTASLIAALLWLLYHLRVRQIKRRNAIAVGEIEMQKNMAELEQQALLLQMNPHFIFNALNSIQHYIGQNDTFSARKYLSKFARLMRQTLQNSSESYIPLTQEIEMLEHYLELEKLCHPGRFSYSIQCSPHTEPETVSIPPMLIQPFAENAILHGILPSQREGRLEITFSLQNGSLLCTVTDNGIGIHNSTQNQSSPEHQSKAYIVTEKRLSLMQQTGSEAMQISVTDLRDEGGTGTRVVLQIPFVMD